MKENESCPNCGFIFNKVRSVPGQEKDKREPDPGDISICMGCGIGLRIQSDLSRKVLTEEELVALKREWPETFELLFKSVLVIAAKKLATKK